MHNFYYKTIALTSKKVEKERTLNKVLVFFNLHSTL